MHARTAENRAFYQASVGCDDRIGCRQSTPSSSIDSCAGVSTATPSAVTGQVNLPRSSRLAWSTSPWPSLHVDREHPHVHLTFARRDHDGRRFHPDRDDLFRYRQRFAEKLRDRGIEANATPARARGIDPTHEPIAARKVRETARVPRIDTSRSDRAERFRERSIPDPVETLLAKRQATVRTAFERSIAELSSSPDLADRVIAKSLERFVASMPAPEPNSIRAARATGGERDPGMSLAATDQREVNVPTAADPLEAASARSRAMRERVEAERDMPEFSDRQQAERVQVRPSGISDRLRSLMDEANKQSAGLSDQGPRQAPDLRQTEQVPERPSGISDRLRSLMEQADKQSADPISTSADEVLRQTQERDREQPERDRSPDRGGPRR